MSSRQTISPRYLQTPTTKEAFTTCESGSPGTCYPIDDTHDYISFDTVGPIYQELPDYLAETNYVNITDNAKTVLQKAYNTDLPGFIWYPSQPKRFAHFQKVMTVQRVGVPDWLSVFPVEQEVGTWSPHPSTPLFVDVGGGFGHQCRSFKAKHPALPGSVVLQDLPQTLEHVPPIEGVDIMVHNFFEPQAMKGESRPALISCVDKLITV